MLTSTLTRAPGAKATRLELTWLVCWPWKRPKCWFSMNSPLWWIARLPNAWQKACKIFWIRGANLGLVELETCWVELSDFFGMFLPLHRAFMLGCDMAELSQICSNLTCFYSKLVGCYGRSAQGSSQQRSWWFHVIQTLWPSCLANI